MFKKDTLVHGIILGILVIVVGYFTLDFLNVWVSRYFFDRGPLFGESSIRVFAIFLNVFPFRYLMLKTNREYTGRGILMVTFVVGLAYFFYYLK